MNPTTKPTPIIPTNDPPLTLPAPLVPVALGLVLPELVLTPLGVLGPIGVTDGDGAVNEPLLSTGLENEMLLGGGRTVGGREIEAETLMDPEPEMGGRAVEADWVGSEVGMGEMEGIGRDVTGLGVNVRVLVGKVGRCYMCVDKGIGTYAVAPGSLGMGSRVAEADGVVTAA